MKSGDFIPLPLMLRHDFILRYCINVQARGAKAVFQFYPENPDQVKYSCIVLYRLTCRSSVCVCRWN